MQEIGRLVSFGRLKKGLKSEKKKKKGNYTNFFIIKMKIFMIKGWYKTSNQ